MNVYANDTYPILVAIGENAYSAKLKKVDGKWLARLDTNWIDVTIQADEMARFVGKNASFIVGHPRPGRGRERIFRLRLPPIAVPDRIAPLIEGNIGKKAMLQLDFDLNELRITKATVTNSAGTTRPANFSPLFDNLAPRIQIAPQTAPLSVVIEKDEFTVHLPSSLKSRLRTTNPLIALRQKELGLVPGVWINTGSAFNAYKWTFYPVDADLPQWDDGTTIKISAEPGGASKLETIKNFRLSDFATSPGDTLTPRDLLHMYWNTSPYTNEDPKWEKIFGDRVATETYSTPDGLPYPKDPIFEVALALGEKHYDVNLKKLLNENRWTISGRINDRIDLIDHRLPFELYPIFEGILIKGERPTAKVEPTLNGGRLLAQAQMVNRPDNILLHAEPFGNSVKILRVDLPVAHNLDYDDTHGAYASHINGFTPYRPFDPIEDRASLIVPIHLGTQYRLIPVIPISESKDLLTVVPKTSLLEALEKGHVHVPTFEIPVESVWKGKTPPRNGMDYERLKEKFPQGESRKLTREILVNEAVLLAAFGSDDDVKATQYENNVWFPGKELRFERNEIGREQIEVIARHNSVTLRLPPDALDVPYRSTAVRHGALAMLPPGVWLHYPNWGDEDTEIFRFHALDAPLDLSDDYKLPVHLFDTPGAPRPLAVLQHRPDTSKLREILTYAFARSPHADHPSWKRIFRGRPIDQKYVLYNCNAALSTFASQ